ncbi:hypothetical protein CAPTEDRAFT_219570 [Capitella teleta]|uniref:C2H2-type domain-containing protein n=1 Tax=Capitella teleta TaxID=283909 RepID=R7UJZ6_CAPTE|nr:hypothetical protein CAPTEDRAFT_219570 [Capitella teleta]|eukprot:ELU04118.1 hypothetical protein CAPTEDRAFT_219570 [Capitella teleta]
MSFYLLLTIFAFEVDLRWMGEGVCTDILQILHKCANKNTEAAKTLLQSKLDLVRQMVYTTVYIVTEREFCINIIMLKSSNRKNKSDCLVSIDLLCTTPAKHDIAKLHMRLQSKCTDGLYILNKNSKLWNDRKLRQRMIRLLEEFAYALVAVATRGEKTIHKILLEKTGLGRMGNKPISLRHLIDSTVAPNWKPFKRKLVQLLGVQYRDSLLETGDSSAMESPVKPKEPVEVVVLDDKEDDDDDCIIVDSDETQDEDDCKVIVIEPVGSPSSNPLSRPAPPKPAAISGLDDLFSTAPTSSSAPLLLNPSEYGQPVVIAPEAPEVNAPSTTATSIAPVAVIWTDAALVSSQPPVQSILPRAPAAQHPVLGITPATPPQKVPPKPPIPPPRLITSPQNVLIWKPLENPSSSGSPCVKPSLPPLKTSAPKSRNPPPTPRPLARCNPAPKPDTSPCQPAGLKVMPSKHPDPIPTRIGPVKLTLTTVAKKSCNNINTPAKPTASSVDGNSPPAAESASVAADESIKDKKDKEAENVKSVNISESPKETVSGGIEKKLKTVSPPPSTPPPCEEAPSPAGTPPSPVVLIPASLKMKITLPNPLKVQGQISRKRRTGGLFPKTNIPPPPATDTQLNAENSHHSPVKHARGRGRGRGQGRGRGRSSFNFDDEDFFPGCVTKKKRLSLSHLPEMPSAGECAEVLDVGMTVKNRRHIQFKEYVCFLCLGSTESFSTSEDFVEHVKGIHLHEDPDHSGDQMLCCAIPGCNHKYQLRGRKNNSKLLDMLTPLFVHMTSGHSRPLPAYVLHYACRECDFVSGIPEFMQKHSLSCRKGVS